MRKVDPVRHEEKRREILEAAGRCFMRDGFHGATTAQICAEANISPGHLYHYFDSKEAIVAGMAEARLDQATERFERLMESPDPVGALIADIKNAKTRKDTAGQTLQLDVLAEARRNPAMAKIVQDNTRRARTMLAAFLRKGQERGQVDPSLDPELTAAVLMGVVDCTKSMAIRDPKLDMKKAGDLLQTMLLRLLTPHTVAKAE